MESRLPCRHLHRIHGAARSRRHRPRRQDIPEGDALQQKLDSIKQVVDKCSDQMKQMMSEHKVIPYAFDLRIKDKIILASIDPTDRAIPKIAFGLNARKYEVVFIKKRDYERIIQSILPAENTFLKQMNETSSEFEIENDEASLDEQELDAEINKSALINLVEGALVEGVRKGASDIHFIPRAGNQTEVLFRLDGNLQIWHKQETTLPEAVVTAPLKASLTVFNPIALDIIPAFTLPL